MFPVVVISIAYLRNKIGPFLHILFSKEARYRIHDTVNKLDRDHNKQ